MKTAELNGLTDEQLVHTGMELERTLLGHSIRHRIGQLENSSLIGKARRDIARVKTVLTSRELANGLDKGALFSKHAGSFVPAAPAKAGSEAGEGFLTGILDKGEGAE
jgi:large subunit ribosomal protein L29